MWPRRRPSSRSSHLPGSAAPESPVLRTRRGSDYANTPASDDSVRLSIPLPRWRWVILTISLATVFAAAMVVLNSPLFEIRSVAIHGTQNVSRESVAQLSGLRGEHILLSNLGEARQRILTQPLIADVTIDRVWPNGVRITVRERTPWAGWEAGGRVWAIDAEGVVLEGFDPPANSVIVRQVSSLPAIRAGTHVDLEVIDLIRRLIEAQEPRNGPRVLGFEWALKTGLTVITQHGRVTFGGVDGFDFKYSVWEELELEAQRRGEPLLTADLRFGTRPSVQIGLGLGRAVRILEP